MGSADVGWRQESLKRGGGGGPPERGGAAEAGGGGGNRRRRPGARDVRLAACRSVLGARPEGASACSARPGERWMSRCEQRAKCAWLKASRPPQTPPASPGVLAEAFCDRAERLAGSPSARGVACASLCPALTKPEAEGPPFSSSTPTRARAEASCACLQRPLEAPSVSHGVALWLAGRPAGCWPGCERGVRPVSAPGGGLPRRTKPVGLRLAGAPRGVEGPTSSACGGAEGRKDELDEGTSCWPSPGRLPAGEKCVRAWAQQGEGRDGGGGRRQDDTSSQRRPSREPTRLDVAQSLERGQRGPPLG